MPTPKGKLLKKLFNKDAPGFESGEEMFKRDPSSPLGNSKKYLMGAGALGAGAALTGDDTSSPTTTPAPETIPSPSPSPVDMEKEAKTGKGAPEVLDMEPPKEFDTKIKHASQLPNMPQPEEYMKQDMGEAQTKLMGNIAAAQKAYRLEKDSLKSKELWEKLLHGVGLMMAGAYGLHTGRNVAGLKFEPTDWNSKASMAARDLESDLRQAGRKYEAVKNIRDTEAKDYQTAMQNYRTILQQDQTLFNRAVQQKQLEFNKFKQDQYERIKKEESERAKELKEMEMGLRGRAAEVKAEGKAKAAGAKDVKKFVEGAKKDLVALGKIKNPTDEQKRMYYEGIATMAREAGIPLDSKIFEKEGMLYGTNPAEPHEAMTILRQATERGQAPKANTVERKLTDGRIGIFNADTKEFIGYK